MKKLHDDVPKVVQSCHDLILWLIPHLDNFPRNRRFTLGERLENSLLAILDHLVAASYSGKKRTELFQANRHLQVVRHLWRLCYELRVISLKRYEYGAQLMVDMGMQIGAWLRSSRS